MRPVCKRLFAEARAAHYKMVEATQALQRELVNSADLAELGDAVFALRKSKELMEDARKECSVTLTTFEQVTCLRWVADPAQQVNRQPIRTDYVTASPDVKQTVKTPKRGTPEYNAFIAHFGVPEGAPFSPHWPSLLKQISTDMAEGKPIPPGCNPNEMLKVCQVRTLKRKRPILDDGEAIDLVSPDCLKSMYRLLDSVQAISTLPVRELIALVEGTHAIQAEDIDREQAEDDQTESLIESDASGVDGAPSFMDETADDEGAPF